MTRILRILTVSPRRNRATIMAGVVTVVFGVTLGSLMAAGCFRGDTAGAEGSTSLAGPEGDAARTALPADPGAVLACLEKARDDGQLSAELVADLRAKIESGSVRMYSASCEPGEGCVTREGQTLQARFVGGAGSEGSPCEPIECTPGECPPEACADLAGAGEGEPICVVMTCDESEFPPLEGAAGETPRRLTAVVKPVSADR